MATSTRLLIGLLVLPVLFLGLYALDFVLGRPDRIAAAKSQADLIVVRDEVLRFEVEMGRQPESLAELVPGYLQREQIEPEGKPRYRYEPSVRKLTQIEGPLIRGIFSRRRAPFGIDLPKPEPLEDLVVAARTPTEKDLKDPKEVTPAKTDIKVVTPAIAKPKPVEPPLAPTPPVPTPVDAKPVVPRGPEFPDPPIGAYVFEAELYSDTNYGWEVHRAAKCSGGAYLHCKEGITNGPAQRRLNLGDFYAVRGTTDYTYLKHHFRLPKAGTYYVYGRLWTSGTHCSNAICVSVDVGGPYHGGMSNRTPFRWVWTQMANSPVHLAKGDHFLHSFIHEDGVKIDQFIVSPIPISGGGAFKANLLTGHGTKWRAKLKSPVHLSLDYNTMILSPNVTWDGRVAIRHVGSGTGNAILRVVLCEAGKDGNDLQLGFWKVRLNDLKELSFIPISLEGLNVSELPRREYQLRAELTAEGGEKPMASAETVLMRPFKWEIFGPGGFLQPERIGPLDGDGLPKPGDKRRWTPFTEKSWDLFGAMDFGVHTSGNRNHAPAYKTLYARTRIRVPKTDTYLLKLQHDDQIIIWIDGSEVCREGQIGPVTRAAHRIPIRLEAGDRRLRFRLNQHHGPWQAAFRFRTQEDELSAIVGLEPVAEK